MAKSAKSSEEKVKRYPSESDETIPMGILRIVRKSYYDLKRYYARPETPLSMTVS